MDLNPPCIMQGRVKLYSNNSTNLKPTVKRNSSFGSLGKMRLSSQKKY
jgi:hypothetical protein